MRLTFDSKQLSTLALAAVAALLLLAPPAFAGRGHGRGHGHGKYDRRIVFVPAPRAYYARPDFAPAPCEPRYVTYRPSRVLIVRPAPFVRIGGRVGAVDISAVFGPRRQYANYEYGCNFCDAHYATYRGYSNHVVGCSHRPADVRIQARAWGDGGYGDARYNASGYDDEDDGYDGYDGY
ncbi:MAG: hypothetical protein ABI960_06160 [Candidatus Eisenbacteria bacterium]